MRGRPNVVQELLQIFTCAGQPLEVQKYVTEILENSSKDHGEYTIIYSCPKISLKCLSFDTVKLRTPPLVTSCSSRDERDEP